MAATCKELISRVFALRDKAHRRHWATDSYSEHMALGDLYDALPDKLDAFIEAYQGSLELVGQAGPVDEDVKALLEWVDANGKELSHDVTHLQNLLDALSESLSTSFYKLRHLK